MLFREFVKISSPLKQMFIVLHLSRKITDIYSRVFLMSPANGPQLYVTPKTLTRGATPNLKLNCSITEAEMSDKNITSLTSIVISKQWSWAHSYVDVVSVDMCCDKSPTVNINVVKTPSTLIYDTHFLYADIQSPGDIGNDWYKYRCQVKGRGREGQGLTEVTLTSEDVLVNDVHVHEAHDVNDSLVSIHHNIQHPDSAQSGCIRVGCNISMAAIRQRFGPGATLSSLSMMYMNDYGNKDLFSMIVDENGVDRTDRFVGFPTESEVTGKIHDTDLPHIEYKRSTANFNFVKGEYSCKAVFNATSSNHGYVSFRSVGEIVSQIQLQISTESWQSCQNPSTVNIACQISSEIRARYIPTVEVFDVIFARAYAQDAQWITLASSIDGDSFFNIVDLEQSAVTNIYHDSSLNVTGYVGIGSAGDAIINTTLHIKPNSCFEGGYFMCKATGIDSSGNRVELNSMEVSSHAIFIIG